MLQPVISTGVHDTTRHENVTDVESIAVYNEEKDEVTIFAVNRNIEEDVELITDVRGLEGYRLTEHIVLEDSDMKLCNGPGSERVCPRKVQQSFLDGGIMTSVLHRASWNVIRLGK